MLFEAVGRVCFPVAVALGLASGQTAVALGIAAAPLLSLLVVPAALARHAAPEAGAAPGDAAELTLRAGAGFAVAVAAVQLAEQTLVNAAVLTTRATAGTVLAGVVFNALLITRAPLQLFQAVQTTLLPHLTGLRTTEGEDDFARTIRVDAAGRRRVRRRGRARPAGDRPVGDGPRLRRRLRLRPLGTGRRRGGHGLPPGGGDAQPGRARPRPRPPRPRLPGSPPPPLFVAWMLTPAIDDELLRAEAGYAAATALLCAALWRLYRYS